MIIPSHVPRSPVGVCLCRRVRMDVPVDDRRDLLLALLFTEPFRQ